MAPSSPSDHCTGCGCPLVGHELFCSACGRRLFPRSPRRLVRSLVVLGLIAAVTAAGMCLDRSRRLKAPPAWPPVREVPTANP